MTASRLLTCGQSTPMFIQAGTGMNSGHQNRLTTFIASKVNNLAPAGLEKLNLRALLQLIVVLLLTHALRS